MLSDVTTLSFIDQDDHDNHTELRVETDHEDCEDGETRALWLDDGEMKILLRRENGKWVMAIWPDLGDTHVQLVVDTPVIAERHWDGRATGEPFGVITIGSKGSGMRRILRWLLGLCDHAEEVIDTMYLKSPSVTEKELALQESVAYDVVRHGIPQWFFRAVLVSVVRCKKCGRVKHVRTKCP